MRPSPVVRYPSSAEKSGGGARAPIVTLSPAKLASIHTVRMAPKMVQHETKKLAIAQHAWSATGSQDSKRYLSFAAGAQIEIVEEREAGGWWAVRSSLLAHTLTRAWRVPTARACLVGRGAWMASSAGFPSRIARWSMRLRALLRQQHRRPSRWCRHRFPIHFNQRRRSPHRCRRTSPSAPTRSP